MSSAQKYKIKFTAFLKTYTLIAAMTVLPAFLAYITLGASFAVTGIVFILIVYLLTPSAAPEVLLRVFRAKKLTYLEAPALFKTLHYLSTKAGLPAVPELYYIQSEKTTAFATGTTEKSGIAISSNLLTSLTLDEIAGVLAHEVTHIANNDMRFMWFAIIMNQATGFLSIFGQILIIINLPLLLIGGASINWLLIALLVFAPTLGYIIQLTLSRVREYSADMGSADLLGRPEPLISALAKIEYQPRTFWGSIVYRRQSTNTSSLFMTHPPTAERIRRLAGMRDRKRAIGNPNLFIHPPISRVMRSMF